MHDNQVLGLGSLGIGRLGLPLVTSIHHPISVDRRIEIEAARGIKQKLGKFRWYGFVGMQAQVSRRIGPVLTVSESSKVDIVKDFKVDPRDIDILPLGVDTRIFHPRGERVPGRIVAMASADAPIKGVDVLLRAVAKVATERDVHVVVVSKPQKDGPTDKLVRELALGDRVKFVSGISDDELGELLASAEIAVVPSRYEGFSLPAVEHMASGTPLVASRAGALPEVVGDAGILVQPGDVEELAATLHRLHDSPRSGRRPVPRGSPASRSASPGRPWRRPPSSTTGPRSPSRTTGGWPAGDARNVRRTSSAWKEHDPADRGFPAVPRPPETASSTWDAVPDGTPSSCTAGVRTSWPSTRTPKSCPASTRCSGRCASKATCPRTRPQRPCRVTRSTCRSPTTTSTRSSRRRCWSTSPTTCGRCASCCASCGRAASWR